MNSIETKWQLIVIIVVLVYAKIDARIHRINLRGDPRSRGSSTVRSHSTDHRTEDDTADDRSQHSAEHRCAMMITLLPRGQRGAASTPGPVTCVGLMDGPTDPTKEGVST